MYFLHIFICYICIYYVDLSCTNKVTEKYSIMRALTNREFKNRVNELNIIAYADMVAVEDEVGNVVEFDTTGNESHVIENILCFDGIEYELTENQKDAIYTMAYLESSKS